MAAKILVVDDDANVQRLLQYTLKQEGYDVVVAGDGAEGFRLWGAEAPDLILLDVQLPKLDGYQVAAKIRSEEGGSSNMATRANRQWKKTLAEYEAPPLDVAIDEALCDYMERKKAAMADAWY